MVKLVDVKQLENPHLLDHYRFLNEAIGLSSQSNKISDNDLGLIKDATLQLRSDLSESNDDKKNLIQKNLSHMERALEDLSDPEKKEKYDRRLILIVLNQHQHLHRLRILTAIPKRS